MNPPYGREIGKWMRKAYEASLSGAKVVCLVPARTDTAWWHDYAMKGQIEFLRGRLKFGNAKNSAPFPSAIVIFAEHLKIAEQKEKANIAAGLYLIGSSTWARTRDTRINRLPTVYMSGVA